jgi:hypothetical protein
VLEWAPENAADNLDIDALLIVQTIILATGAVILFGAFVVKMMPRRWLQRLRRLQQQPPSEQQR